MKTIIAIDVGTTHIKSILFDEEGQVLKEEKAPMPVETDGIGSIYHPERVWQVVKNQVDELFRESSFLPMGISITGMAEAGLIVNRDTKKVESMIIPWFDKRTENISKMSPEENELLFKTTGLFNSFKYGIYKFLWLLENNHVDKQTAIWLSMCDYIAFRLTGDFATDPSYAARTYVYNVIEGCWDEQRIQAYGLTLANFPKIIPSGTVVGSYTGVPVVIAGHDHICTAYGLLYHDSSGVCDSAGTSETYVGFFANNEIEKTGFQSKSGLLYGPFLDQQYFFMANLPSSGHSIEWFRKTAQIQKISYSEMNDNLKQLCKEPTKILYYPYLTGMGTPLYRNDYKGMFLGLSEQSTGYEMLKAIIEGIQFQARWIIERINQYHCTNIAGISCAGGSVFNETMMQIKANILEMEVAVPAVAEATLTGAAAIFLSRNKSEKAAERFLQQPLQIKKKYFPDRSVTGKYKQIFTQEYLPFLELLQKYKSM